MTVSFEEGCASLGKLVGEAMGQLDVPGVAVAIHRDGQDYVEGFGVTSVEHPLPVDGQTLFQVGSTTKTLTALVALRLVEGGRADLDEPVRSYLPDLELASPEVTEGVTLRHLLTHTAGFDGDLFDDFGPGDDALARAVDAMRNLPQITPLGEVWNYNNAGFNLAGRVIEAITDTTFERAVADVVLEPLDLTRSFFLASDCITHRVAAGHAVTQDGPVVLRPWQLPRAINPAGGLISCAEDQLAYARFHLGDGTAPDGTRLFDRDTLVGMREPQIEAGGGRAAYGGLSWLIQRTPGLLAHGGSTIGQESAFVVVPDHGFAMTVLTNADRGVVLQREVTKWALRNLVDLERPSSTQTPVSAGELDRFIGRFHALHADLIIERDGDGVTLCMEPGALTHEELSRPLPPVPVEVYDDGGCKILEGPQVG
ncbi:MAG TPA: serine hydrolase domain-containing protein, partial [Nitriliruptorales bacterium]